MTARSARSATSRARRAPAAAAPVVPREKQNAKRAKADAYRRLIMEAGEQVFAQHGFDAAKIQDIAQAAGLSLGTVYSVFPGKTELYTAIQTARGSEVLAGIQNALIKHEGVLERALAGIAAYVHCLVERPHYLHIHLREGLTFPKRSSLRSGEESAIWERGVELALQILKQGIVSGFLHADNEPAVLLKMMITSHQVQLSDWLERGADAREVEHLIVRMQDHFRRAFVRDAAIHSSSATRAKASR